jgi:site-specific recombinase XerD
MRVSSALSHYLNSLQNQTTKTNYEIVLKDFLTEIENLDEITQEAIISFKGSLAGKAPQTVAARLSAVRSFCDYCWTNGWMSMDPSLAVKNNPVQKYASAKNIAFQDFKKVLAEVDLSKLVGVRDYLLMRLIFVYGDPTTILRLPFDYQVNDTLKPLKEEYFTKLSEKTSIDSLKLGYLFFNLETCINAKPLSLSSCRKIIAKYTKRAGFPDKFLDFQALKRLRARQIYEQTNSEKAVQQFCGHKSLKATRAFIKTLSTS